MDAREPIDEADGTPEGRTHFHAVLQPHRSLNRPGFFALMGVLVVANLVIGTFSFIHGAWPVLGFLGLDVLAVFLAFRVNYRAARLYEEVRLTDTVLRVDRVWPSRRMRTWRFEPYWLRVQIDDPPRHESQIRLVSHGRTLTVGAFLSPDERADFAVALRDALDRWRDPGQLADMAPA
jgi:uncharacterized membrane protein